MVQLTEQEKQKLTTIRQAKLEILFTARDDDGNFLVFNKGQLYLRQNNEDHNRRIGDIYYANDILLYAKWEKEKDVFQKMDAWSIPLIIAKNVDVVNFKTSSREYWITYDVIKELLRIKQASILKFAGMEKKIYIPRKFWKETIVSPFEGHDLTLLAHNPVPDKTKDVQPIQENMEKYTNRVGPEWAEVLYKYFETPYMKSVGAGIAKARNSGKIVYPKGEDVFRAFRMTPYSLVRIVILGQDFL